MNEAQGRQGAGCGRTEPLVVGILGPTAVGKTAVAAALARRMGTRIISCDSMQVYEGFPVLTNQPQGPDDAVDLHELVGFVDPARSFSAGEYAALARGLVDREIRSRGKALVVGGSGLYMRAALAPLAARKAGDPGLRELLARRARRQGIDLLYAELATLEPEAARRLDARNERRVLRALEVVLAGNGPWSGRSDLWAPVYDHPTLVVGMVMDKAVLGRRIVTRARRIVEEGAVEEVRRFREERGYECTVPGSPGICSAIGYSESALLAKREIDGATAVEQIAAATRGYARRQLTWLRKVRGAVMIDVRERRPDELAEEILAIADSHAARGERRLS